MELISLENLTFTYASASLHRQQGPVLCDLSLKIYAGELIAIQGPSGSGKSTLLYVLGLLLRNYTGTVRLGGHNIAQLTDEQLATLRNRFIGFVFQQFHLLPKANVEENILLPGHYPLEKADRTDARPRAINLAQELGLEEKLKHFPNQLSGGQQQRVAIARALLNDTQIILADEPTGGLDTQNAAQIMNILKEAASNGRTVVIITHDADIASQCDKIVHFKDGRIVDTVVRRISPHVKCPDISLPKQSMSAAPWDYLRMGVSLLPQALQNMRQNISRTVLTMLGIVIGVAAVVSMLTIGAYTKKKILDSYAELGVNTLMFQGYPNWSMRATDQVSTVFQAFEWDRDIMPALRVFPSIHAISPLLSTWNNQVSFGGKTADEEVRVMGISSDGLALTNRKLVIGSGITPFHVKYRSPVCVIGMDIFTRLFRNTSPLGKIIFVIQREASYGCRVVGVLKSQTSNKDWNKPNMQLYLPYTFFQGVSDPWSGHMRQLILKVHQGEDVERVGKAIKSFFQKKYGKSGDFHVGSDGLLVAQMNKFLGLFTIMLGAIALVSLGVGGIGITNMMLVSVSERLKEIGIRKAVGATHLSIRMQYLVESILVCAIAGVVGIFLGVVFYELAIYGATKLVANLTFEWVVEWPAIILSIVSIFTVGVLSGLIPALKAERLQVIEALRSD